MDGGNKLTDTDKYGQARTPCPFRRPCPSVPVRDRPCPSVFLPTKKANSEGTNQQPPGARN